MTVITRLEFEHAFYDSVVESFNYYTAKTRPIDCTSMWRDSVSQGFLFLAMFTLSPVRLCLYFEISIELLFFPFLFSCYVFFLLLAMFVLFLVALKSLPSRFLCRLQVVVSMNQTLSSMQASLLLSSILDTYSQSRLSLGCKIINIIITIFKSFSFQ